MLRLGKRKRNHEKDEISPKCTKTVVTRSATYHYLIGHASPSITGCRLPTLRQVMKYLLHLKSVSPHSTSTRKLIYCAVDETTKYWRIAGIKTIKVANSINHLTNVWNDWMGLKKSIKRTSDSGEKRQKFIDKLDKLWDIGSPDAIDVIRKSRVLSQKRKADDVAFYLDQRTARSATIDGDDRVLNNKLSRKQKHKRIQIAKTEQEENVFSETEDCESISSQMEVDNSSEYEVAGTHTKDKFITLRAPRKFLANPEIVTVLDRLKLSNNAATMLLTSFINVCNGDINDFSISRSTIRRVRIAKRLEISSKIFDEVNDNPPEWVALHWDGKLTKDKFGVQYEALAIIVSGAPKYTSGKLLGVQKLDHATGKAQAQVSFDLLEMWNLTEKVKALVFDTTASNSGWKGGAAKILEESINSKLFYCACRHHIYELVIGTVWKKLFGSTTTGPDNPLFIKLKANWGKINKFQNFRKLEPEIPWLISRRSQVITELTTLLKGDSQSNFRADYKECADNTLALLKDTPHKGFHHRRPGATHNARWMGQLLYAQKMLMWSHEMGYKIEFIQSLERLNTFIALFYTQVWLNSSIGSDAAIDDFYFLKDMIQYKQIDSVVAEAAFRKLSGHRWYLTQEMVIFAMFSDNPKMTNEMKRNMATKLLSIPQPVHFRRGKPVMHFEEISVNTKLEDLIGKESWFIFTTLNIKSDWLALPVDEWASNEDFLVAKSFVHTVKVVNDAAERGVKLNTEYAAILTDNPEQRACLLQAVELHRKEYPDFRKKTLRGAKLFKK